MQTLDYTIVAAYLIFLLLLGFYRRLGRGGSVSQMILGGRQLTLPAFVASLVSTWYGGILGVGEYSYNYGLSNWLVFGLPYYLAAFLFALFLAKRARRSELLTIPDMLAKVYDKKSALVGSIVIYFMTVPAVYILMLGILSEYLFGWSFEFGLIVFSVISLIYVYFGGFNSVVRTDIFQFFLMFIGFGVMLFILISEHGVSLLFSDALPSEHLSWHGGNSTWYIATWYIIALSTLIEPAFYQRCFAAKSERTAQLGIFISIGCWAFFDFMTTTCGLYARALLPDLSDPVAAFPLLAIEVLPVGLLGLFALALLATVMSTVDSNSFLAASTYGNDILPRLGLIQPDRINFHIRVGLILSSMLAILLALYFESVVDYWHLFGSIGTPALLLPVFLAFVSKSPPSAGGSFISMIAGGGLSLIWYMSGNDGEFWFSLQPIIPGLVVSALVLTIDHFKKPISLLPIEG